MIEFMVLAGPRSATTWLSNLLTTDHTLCMHDPLLEYTTLQLDQVRVPGKRLGIADTSVLLWPEWLLSHPAKKIILWRDPREINDALRRLGMREIEPHVHARRVNALPKVRTYQWDQVFRWPTAKAIADYFEVPLDRWRFQELVKMNVQPQFSRLPIAKEAVRELVQRIAKEYNS